MAGNPKARGTDAEGSAVTGASGSDSSDSCDDSPVRSGPTDTARELQELKRRILETLAKREIVPQPLFWSLFLTRLQAIKDRRAAERLLEELLAS